MISSDRPIVHKAQDSLHRVSFSRKLGDAVLNSHKNESFVIALYGPWGSGKTSVLNLTIEYIQQVTQSYPGSKKPIIVHFNPWSYSSKDQLINALFTQLQAEIHKVDPKLGVNIKGKLNKFAKALGSLGDVPYIGNYAGAGTFLVNLFAKEQTVEDVKNDIAKEFAALYRRIVIIIDDVDRLTDEEIRTLFQIIKINADFPNTIYLVAFSREVVEKALEGQQNVSGRSYLEKIVQIGFDLPDIERRLIEKILIRGLENVLDPITFTDFDQNYWQSLYNKGFFKFFSTLRDVKRYHNSLVVTLNMVRGEVNPVDFMAIEALRIFQPDVYEEIAKNRDLFLFHSNGISDKERQDYRNVAEEIFKIAGDKGDLVRQICMVLFPQLSGIYGNHILSTDHYRLWRKGLRICARELFDVYFLLGVPSDSISISELNKLTNLHNKDEELQLIFDEYVQSDRITMLLERMGDVVDGSDSQKVKNLSIALLNFANRSPYFQREMLGLEPDKKAVFVTARLLENVEEEKRYQLAVNEIQSSKNLFAIVYLIKMDQDEGRYRYATLFSKEHWESLRIICVEKIEQLLEEDALLDQKYPAALLYRLKEWSQDLESLQRYISKIASDPISFAQYLSFFIREVLSQEVDNYNITRENYLDVSELFNFIPRERIEEIVGEIIEKGIDCIPEEYREGILLVEKGLKDPDWYQK